MAVPCTGWEQSPLSACALTRSQIHILIREAGIRLTIQQNRPLRIPKTYFHRNDCSSQDPELTHTTPDYTITFYLLWSNFNIIISKKISSHHNFGHSTGHQCFLPWRWPRNTFSYHRFQSRFHNEIYCSVPNTKFSLICSFPSAIYLRNFSLKIL